TGCTGNPPGGSVASDAQLTALASAFITVSFATGEPEFFDQSSNTFAPGCKPATTPLIEPAPSVCIDELTSAPFSLSVAFESSALEGALSWMVTDEPVAMPVRAASGVAIEYAGSACSGIA